jgi:hypothetical protein
MLKFVGVSVAHVTRYRRGGVRNRRNRGFRNILEMAKEGFYNKKWLFINYIAAGGRYCLRHSSLVIRITWKYL